MGGLYLGGYLIVHSAIQIAMYYALPRFLVGTIIVAMGTSLPELFAVLNAAFLGESLLVINGLMGSNVFNFALIAGIILLFSEEVYPRYAPYRDMLFLILSLVVLTLTVCVVSPQKITLIEGTIFLAGFIGYLWSTLTHRDTVTPGQTSISSDTVSQDAAEKKGGLVGYYLLILAAGIVALGLSSYFLLENITAIANTTQSPEVRRFLGVVVLAFGTSLPELITSLVALIKKEGEISLGNLVGSNVFNILCILPLATFFQPLIVTVAAFDLSTVWISTILISCFLYLRKRRRVFGGMLSVLFILYVGQLVMSL